MKLRSDAKPDAIYLRLDDSKIVESEESDPSIVLDCNNHNQVVGNESLDVRDRGLRANLLDRLLVEGANESGHQLPWIGNITG